MSLSPLPISKVSDKPHQDTSALPYPELGKTQYKPAKPTMTRQWGADTSAQPSEQQRMSELEKMLSEAQSRAAIVEQEAYDKAYAAGEKAGLALGEKRAEQILETMNQVVIQAEEELQHLQQQSATVVVELSQAIVKHVLGEHEGGIYKVLEKTIHQVFTQFHLETHDHLVLAIHPKDLNMFSRMQSLPEQIKLKPYEQVSLGSCKLLSAHQDILIDPLGMIDKAAENIYQQLQSSSQP